MEAVLSQFGLDSNPFSFILSFVFLVIFFMFYPRLMLTQIMWRLEKTVKDLEEMSIQSKEIIAHEIREKPDPPLKEAINRFYEFFVIGPVDLDPYGIVRKIEHVVQAQRERFRHFARQVAPHKSEEEQANIEMGLAGGMTVYEITKVVRHYVEIARKTKSFQIAMILQMQLPLIERMVRSVFKGTKAMVQGKPIGDALGPYVVARLMGNERPADIAEDIVMVRRDLKGRDVFLLKARGPGGRLGRPGVAVQQIMKSHKVAKIISVDAAAKLEGEETGSVAEGIGVAMGGIGVERSFIEDVAVKAGVPLDSVIVKMSPEEAIEPLQKVVIAAYPKVVEAIERSLETTRRGSKVIIVGVGNTSGVGNSQRSTEETDHCVEAYEKQRASKKKNAS